jgi:hypothetical protein
MLQQSRGDDCTIWLDGYFSPFFPRDFVIKAVLLTINIVGGRSRVSLTLTLTTLIYISYEYIVAKMPKVIYTQAVSV